MDTFAYILSLSALVAQIASSLCKGKNMKIILMLLVLSNLLMASSYVVTHNTTGAVTCTIGAVQSLINYLFTIRNKKLPLWLIAVYALSFIAANLIVYKSPTDILAIAASLCFVLCILQENGKAYRLWVLVNGVLWCLYDIFCGAYGPLVTHVLMSLFTVAGMLIHDRKKRKS